MIITLPWPDKRLSPNAKRRLHWTVYRKPAKDARYDGMIAAYGALGCSLSATKASLVGNAPIPLTVTFYPPDKRHRDDDGMVGSFKHARDGIADALGVDDRRFRPHYIFAEPEKPGRVEVVL